MTGRHAARGFSLIELVIALGISVIVIAGGLTLMVSQQHLFRTTAGDRNLQENARIAVGAITSDLRMAGFGVDPSLAFDFGPMANLRMDRAYGGLTFASASGPTGSGNACGALCRDSTAGPDEIAFFSRDPSFGPHPLTVAATAATTTLRFALLPGQTSVDVQAGQVLQLVCYTGAMTWAYVTATGAAAVQGDGTATVTIANAGGTTFPNQTAFLADPCFGSVATVTGGLVVPSTMAGAVQVLKVDRYHYFIQSYDAAGNIQPWGSANARPYLMVDHGLIGVGGIAQVPVAPDVEDLQFAYVFPNAAATPLVGATSGAAIGNGEDGINLAPAAGGPAYSDPTNSLTRQNHHPGNIGAVRLSVVVRTPVADLGLANSATVPAAGNRPDTAGPAGYTRLLVDTTIAVPNLGTLAPYFPTYTTFPATSGNRQLNVGGG
jgi:type IV pilus assembly protein PilW